MTLSDLIQEPMSRAVFVGRYGGPEVLDVVWRPLSRVGARDVLIEAEAAGVAYADVLMRQGRYPGGPRPPFVPGWDVMGRVVQAGPEVDPALLGRRVLALPLAGGAAEHVAAPVERTTPLPDDVDPYEAACLTMNYVTAWQMLRLAGAQAGQTLLVHGAAGGVEARSSTWPAPCPFTPSPRRPPSTPMRSRPWAETSSIEKIRTRPKSWVARAAWTWSSIRSADLTPEGAFAL